MKFLINLWRFLSFPLILGGLALSWWGVNNWTMSSGGAVMSAAELLSSHAEIALLKDSLRYDLSTASIRQENFMGVKSPAVAAFPAWAGADSGRTRFVVYSSQPNFLGPTVKSFMQVDSADGAISVESSSKGSKGVLVPVFDALVQTLASQMRPHLTDSVRGRFMAQGTAIRRTDSSKAGIDSVASEYWEVRLEGVPSRQKVLSILALGIALIFLGIALQIVVKKWENQRAEEDEEERSNEKPLV
ncbi:MAG: hypothetical protein RL173_1415 [Fibrobacterota bacterium]|jgi:hypothetical protein